MAENIVRCGWAGNDPAYIDYHDKEWGVPVYDDHRLFEFLVLETFQAGLSWLTILRKRENFRKAFDGFDFDKVALYDSIKVEQLMQDAGIVRNRMKIEAAVKNARAFIKIRSEFGSFSNYIWSFTGGNPVINNFSSMEQLPAKTEISDIISRELKKRGFAFVGSTVIYAHMQATGMVNDHLTTCFRHRQITESAGKQSD